LTQANTTPSHHTEFVVRVFIQLFHEHAVAAAAAVAVVVLVAAVTIAITIAVASAFAVAVAVAVAQEPRRPQQEPVKEGQEEKRAPVFSVL